jgi:DNA-binding transcriptional regulator of glucitol operon
MSISNPKLKNPCSKFIEYSGDSGKFHYYDKDEEKKIPVKTPIYFVVLDELSTITGFNEKHKSGIFSNEVHSTIEVLRVRTFKGGVSITGKYKEISDEVKAIGGKFTKSVYCMLVGKNVVPELVNFKFKGSAFNGWLDKKFDVYSYVVGIVDFEKATKGKTEYLVPVFKPFKLTDEILEDAKKLDVVLQKYLTEYKAQIPEKEIAQAESVYENEEPQAKGEWTKESLKREDIGGSLSSIDDVDEIPF